MNRQADEARGRDYSRDDVYLALQTVKAAMVVANGAVSINKEQAEAMSDFARYCIMAQRAAEDYIDYRNKMGG